MLTLFVSEFRKHGDMETCRHVDKDMKTWRQRHGDMETRKWRHGDMETCRHVRRTEVCRSSVC
jgi:hypothetical protein